MRDWLLRCSAEVWRAQYLFSLIAHGLVFTTYDNLGPKLREWFYRLAGHAAREVLSYAPTYEPARPVVSGGADIRRGS